MILSVTLILVSMVLAFLRFCVKSHDAIFDATNLLKTFAHFFLGFLLGLTYATWSSLSLLLFTLLTAVELFAFFTSGARILFTREPKKESYPPRP